MFCCCQETAEPNLPNQMIAADSVEGLSVSEEVKLADTPIMVARDDTKSASISDLQITHNGPMTAEEEERQAEKAKLQKLVSKFASKAVKGCRCVYFNESAGERVQAAYCIDKAAKYFIVLPQQEGAKPELTFELTSLEDVYSLATDGIDCFPDSIVSGLAPEERELLVMVVYNGSQPKTYRFCLLVDCAESRDRFLECLKVLCIYAKKSIEKKNLFEYIEGV